MVAPLIHWGEIAYWALICLIQEMKGEEPDCPDCWKCESMRVLILCLVAFVVTKLSLWVL
ncbi:MAG: hypothetical protein ACKO0Z_07375 [Betaproteobacteria bacterium]